ncbi:MAG: phosphogluconate dehydratase [Bacteroidia bacterium]|nr:phosphogluconate dehydratase [Bacteroidia bacterium]
MNPKVLEVTERIIARSKESRKDYLDQMDGAVRYEVSRKTLSCGNLAHAFAGCPIHDKDELSGYDSMNLGIITSYNDMLSAHKVFETYPEQIRNYARKQGAVAQVAGAVPAMCDGVTQGQVGMELSLLSRDTIALSTAISLSHNMYDGVILLGTCDKIVPGLLIGALRFGNLPTVFLPGGPMPTGISNEEKARIRQLYAEGKIGRDELLKGESDSYHSPGTCTFYGTANSNQMLVEIMGLQLPGSSFVNPGTELRTLLNEWGVKTIVENANSRKQLLCHIIDEKTIVNALVGLLATGGSTNHTLHLVAIAKAAGIRINWDDFSDLSDVVPSITKVYPNGSADVNNFHASGGMSFVIRTLLDEGYLHEDVNTILGKGLRAYIQEPKIRDNGLIWEDGPEQTLNEEVVRSAQKPFSRHGGIAVLNGNIGRSVIKTSAVEETNLAFTAPAVVFDEQSDLITAFKRGELERDFIAVLPFQGPRSNGMPELHKLTPTLTVLLKRGFKVALITDGRMSGASGKVPSAIHMSPEALDGSILAKIKTGDMIEFDAVKKSVNLLNFEEVNARESRQLVRASHGLGRELFTNMRAQISTSESGASFLL